MSCNGFLSVYYQCSCGILYLTPIITQVCYTSSVNNQTENQGALIAFDASAINRVKVFTALFIASYLNQQ
jgi:type IV secretory pathway component VirB8